MSEITQFSEIIVPMEGRIVHSKQFHLDYSTNVGNNTISTKSIIFPYVYYPN